MSKFGMTKFKPLHTPISTSKKVDKDAKGKDVDTKLYRSLIGSLLYLIASRPGISFSIGVCARHQIALKELHLKVTKRIIRYICGTLNYGLWYPFDTNNFIASYLNANWAENVVDRKSTGKGCFYVRNCL